MYLGYFLTNELTDNEDMEGKRRRLYQRKPPRSQVPLLLCEGEVSIVPNLLLSDAYVCPVGQTQAGDSQSTRSLLQQRAAQTPGIPPWSSAGSVFVTRALRGFQENLRYASYNMKLRIEGSCKFVLYNLNIRGATILSPIRNIWIMFQSVTV